jgi:GT2 family glycosyltransferase
VTGTRKSSASVIIVNWNRCRLLQRCLASLSAQSATPSEVIVVDNCSSDGSTDLVRTQFPHTHLIELRGNVGFAQASNIGIRQAQGEYIALLNNDAEAAPTWLGGLIATLDANPDCGFCASKMLLYNRPHLADACGDFYTIEGIPGKVGHLEAAERYSKPCEVFGACAGAAIYRRELIEEVGGFDEDFFIVHEDSDLSFAARLLGYKCVYVPTAIVYHHLGATIGPQSILAVYHAARNREFVFYKNMPWSLLVRYSQLHFMSELLSFARHIPLGRGTVFLKAKIDALTMMPSVLRKRRRIQAARRASVAEIDRLLVRDRLSRRAAQGIRDSWEHLRRATPGR